MFLAFKAFVEKQYEHQILKLIFDNGGEYVNNKFINFCVEHGIQMQHNVPYTPQQNDVAESKNHTLMEMANSCAHIPDEKHKDLEPKREKCIFVGYFEDVKGYRLIPLKSKNVTIRRDVKFVENILAYEPSSANVPPFSIHSTSENISSLGDDNEDDNSPPPSQGQKLVRCKWVYRTKFGPYGKVDKLKTHIVAKGFSQVEGIEYTETFSPGAKMNPICLVLSLASSFKWEAHRMDVKSTFLHGDLHEEIYMEKPLGYIQTNYSLVFQLKKSLYGLKKAPQAWYTKMDSFPLYNGFSRCHSDNTVYTKKEDKSLIILVLYVDDLILTGSDPNLINHVNSNLKK
eukprot:PITA_21863